MRATSARRLCALGSAVLIGLGVGVVPASAGGVPAVGGSAVQPRAESSSSVAAQVAALNASIERVGAELAQGAIAYEAAAQELARLTQQQFAAGADSDALREAATDSRSGLAGLARAAYKGGMPPAVTALLSGDPRAVSDLAYVQKSVNRVGASRSRLARDLDEQNAGAGRALVQSDALRREALARRQALDGQLAALAEKTDRLTAELSAAAVRLEQARAVERARAAQEAQERAVAQARETALRQAQAAQEAQRAQALADLRASGADGGDFSFPAFGGGGGGGSCQLGSVYGEANGFLSEAGLCPLDGGSGHRLRTDAARAFVQMTRARQAETGAPLCITDSYRSYAGQVTLFKTKPGLAAVPGRSQHGWGLAVDLCGGVQNFGSEAHVWMQRNAARFGWYHPSWAQQGGSRPEPWHWEFAG